MKNIPWLQAISKDPEQRWLVEFCMIVYQPLTLRVSRFGCFLWSLLLWESATWSSPTQEVEESCDFQTGGGTWNQRVPTMVVGMGWLHLLLSTYIPAFVVRRGGSRALSRPEALVSPLPLNRLWH